jgi:SecDF, P1 head subdomain
MRRDYVRVLGWIRQSYIATSLFLASCGTGVASHATEPAASVPPLQFAEIADPGETQGIEDYARREGPMTYRLRTPRVFRLKSARRGVDENGFPAIEFEIADSQKEEFRTWTAELVDHQLAILVDGKVLTAPTVHSPVPGRGIIPLDIARNWTTQEIDALAAHIQGRASG